MDRKKTSAGNRGRSPRMNAGAPTGLPLGFDSSEGCGAILSQLHASGERASREHTGEDVSHSLLSGHGHRARQHHVVRLNLALEMRLVDLAQMLASERGVVLLQHKLLLTYAPDVLDGHVPGSGKLRRRPGVDRGILEMTRITHVLG